MSTNRLGSPANNNILHIKSCEMETKAAIKSKKIAQDRASSEFCNCEIAIKCTLASTSRTFSRRFRPERHFCAKCIWGPSLFASLMRKVAVMSLMMVLERLKGRRLRALYNLRPEGVYEYDFFGKKTM